MRIFSIKMTLFVLLITSSANGKEFSLICPTDFKAKGQAWYAETTKNNSTCEMDFTHELVMPSSTYKPLAFSVCIICTNFPLLESKLDAEICIGHKTMKKTHLAHERLPSLEGDHNGTLVWSKTENPVGLKVDMSSGDLLSTLQNIQPITNVSLQPSLPKCPDGFQIERFESRSYISGIRNRPCFICSQGKNGRHSFSFCVSNPYKKDSKSFVLPSLYAGNDDCPQNWNSTPEVCNLDVKQLLKGNQNPCGMKWTAVKFFLYHKDVTVENLNFDCSFIKVQGKFSKIHK